MSDAARKILEAERFEVDVAVSAQEALDRLAQRQYAAVLCEMQLADMSGKDFYRHVREQFPDYRSRIIFVTGDLVSEAIWEFLDRRRLPYILKPFVIPEFRRRLQEVAGEQPEPPPPPRKQGEELRRCRRIPLKAKIRVRQKKWTNRGPEICAVVNASKEGVYFLMDRPYEVGTELLVCFPYTGANDIEQEALVARAEQRPDGRHGVAIATGEAAVLAREALLGKEANRRQHKVTPPADTLVGAPQPLGPREDAQFADLKKKMTVEREEARRLAEQLADLQESYERVNTQREELATQEMSLQAQLRALGDAKTLLAQMVDDIQGQMTTLRQQVQEDETIRFQATHDSLTGLWNRGATLDILSRELDRVQREGTPVGVVLADLDHFKDINDTYGHLAGDAVLREVASRMTASVRSYDAVGRYGGEEFLIVLPGCNADDTFRQAERIRTQIASEAVSTEEGIIPVTISLGTMCTSKAVEVESLLRVADAALYRAKSVGRNRTEAGTSSDESSTAGGA